MVPNNHEPNKEIMYSHIHNPNQNYDTTLTTAIANTIGVDPTTTKLHLDNHIDPHQLNKAQTTHQKTDKGPTTVTFPYGEYTIECRFNGIINIHANPTDYQNNNVKLPNPNNTTHPTPTTPPNQII